MSPMADRMTLENVAGLLVPARIANGFVLPRSWFLVALVHADDERAMATIAIGHGSGRYPAIHLD
jgi:hypothetical protein